MMNLFTKQKQTHRHRQGAYVYQGNGWVRGIVSEFGTDTYTLLCLTQIASDDRESACDVGDLGSILVWEDLLEKGMATHSSVLAWRIPMDRGAWRTTVHGVAKSQTELSD